MSKRAFKSQASSSRVAPSTGFGGFGSISSGSSLSYLSENPDLSSLSDANVVVAFKNLTKKDAITKAKALEDLRAYVQAHPYEARGGAEEGVLEAWVKLYPRLSIDNSRRVRELSHIIQYELLKTTRKRLEKHIPKIVGAWLAGTYDRDRGVARSAFDGIASFLDTELKRLAFWRRCQAQILEYAQDTFRETPQTLSDERTVSADEMQEKYFRVVGSSVWLVLNLLIKLSAEDIRKYQHQYEDFLSNNKELWGLASCEDSHTRRSVNQLLMVCLDKQPDAISAHLKVISQSFISEALVAVQANSSFQLLQALSALTVSFPEVWTSKYKSSKPPISKLRRFIEKGSQGGPPEFWSLLQRLISELPDPLLTLNLKEALSFMDAFRTGVTSREESRGNTLIAWSSYFSTCLLIVRKLSASEDKNALITEAILPVFENYLHTTSASAKWPISGQSVAEAYEICATLPDETTKTLLEDRWRSLSEEFIVRLQTSLPEQSKDFQKSQASVLASGQRWFELYGLLEKKCSTELLQALQEPSSSIVQVALKVMKSRDGKPYSAAATVESGLRNAPNLLQTNALLDLIKQYLEESLAVFVLSPSSPHVIAIFSHMGKLPEQADFFAHLWQTTVEKFLRSSNEESKLIAVERLTANEGFTDLAHENQSLQDFLFASSSKAMLGDSFRWSLHDSTIRYNTLTNGTASKIIETAISGLDVDLPSLEGALRVLESFSKKPDLFNAQALRIALVTKLLALTELSDSSIAPRAIALQAAMESTDRSLINEQNHDSPIVHVIRANLEFVDVQSLSVDTLIEQAQLLLKDSEDISVLSSLLVATGQWSKSLQQHLQSPVNPALGVMRPFAGSVFLVTPGAINENAILPRDDRGFSIALRTAIYHASLVSKTAFGSLPTERQIEILYLLQITAELATDQLNLREDHKLFLLHEDTEHLDQIRDFVSNVQAKFLELASDCRSWRRNEGDATLENNDFSSLVHEYIFTLIRKSANYSPEAYYSAKALTHIISMIIDAQGWQLEGGDEWLTKVDILKPSSTNYLGAASIINGIGEDLDTSKLINNLCNRLISDVAGASAQSQKTLPLLVLLNSVLAIYAEGDLPVAQNRVVFAVKQMLSWTSNLAVTEPQLASETCHALHKLLPAMKGVYGSYWEDALRFCVSIWKSCSFGKLSDESIPMIGMSLKLYHILKNLMETNDDLEEALVEFKDHVAESLVGLLKLRRSKENEPLEFVDGLIARLVLKTANKAVGDPSELYPLVASEFKIVQATAHDLIASALPELQRELSVTVLLDNTDARLPEELLSLLLDAPKVQHLSDNELVTFPSAIRGYLFSWHLVFSSYTSASYKIRNDYTEILKSENYIAPFLDFLFDVLGHSAGKPFNIDKFNFSEEELKSYDTWLALNTTSSERHFQWLLLNLYYLALKYTPNLVKSWWLDCKSKQTRNAVESWTQKYFAPLVIQDVLDEVAQWAEDQEAPVDDEKELIVKVGKKAREIYAGYEVDDMMVQIVFRLPANYPLEGVKVEGVNRVAASEKKWNSWLMITQGAITFSNGSITDGLLIFRKNVIGALKGQTECAICYSIISADKKMPDKRCQTCKNLFHSGCLFKWFASSNQNTCPLCRNPFNYGMAAKRGK